MTNFDVKLIDIIGFVAGILTSAAYIPQINKVLKTQRARDLSTKMLSILGVGLSIWWLYGYLMGNIPMIAANTFAVLSIIFLLILKYKYRNNA